MSKSKKALKKQLRSKMLKKSSPMGDSYGNNIDAIEVNYLMQNVLNDKSIRKLINEIYEEV